MKKLYFVLFVLVLLAFAPAVLASGPSQASQPDFVTMTIAQFIAWLVSFGIATGVAYVLAQFPQLDDKAKTALAHVVNAVLAAFVVAVAQLIPQTVLDMRLFDAGVAVFAFIINWAGAFLGQLKGQQTYIARVGASATIKSL